MRLAQVQRQHLAETFREVANLIMAAVVIAGLLERSMSISILAAVLGVYGVVVVLTTWLVKGR